MIIRAGGVTMWIGVSCLILFVGVISTMQIFINRNWKCIYTAYGYQNYFKIIGQLKQKGISYKTKIPMNLRVGRYYDNTQYDIYVKKDLEHKAMEALNHQ